MTFFTSATTATSTGVSSGVNHALQTETLENGALLLFNPLPEAPRLSICFFVPGGNTLDLIPGMADLMDRLVMKGTPKRDQEALAQALDGLSLEVDIDTRRDYSVIGSTLLEEDLEESFELISDFFFNAHFEEFEKEKLKLIGELQMELDSHRALASDLFITRMFGGTRYGATSTMFLKSVEQFNDVNTLKQQYQKIYQPQRLVISVSGNIDKARLIKALNHYFPKRAETVAEIPEAEAKALLNYRLTASDTVTVAKEDTAQCHIYQGWLAPNLASDDFYPMVILNTLLGAGGLSSRLFLELRDKQGLAYTVRSNYDAYRYNGLFFLYIGTEPSNRQKCLDGFQIECQKLMEIPVGDEELHATKVNILGRRAVFLETAAQQASYYGSNFIQGRKLEDIERLEEKINAVTAADIQRAAKACFSQPSIITIVGPSAAL